MNGLDPAALREEYCALVLATIQRYVADGHRLAIETAAPDKVVRVSLDFDPAAFGDYFAHMGDGVSREIKASSVA